MSFQVNRCPCPDPILCQPKERPHEGERLRDGLDGYIWYYVYRAKVFTLHERPAIQLDARVFSDPEGRDLRSHTGRHHEIINRMVAHEIVRTWIRYAHRTFAKALVNRTDGRMLSAVMFCRSGKHRGFAAAVILEHVLSQVEGWKFLLTIHMSIDVDREGCRCKNCRPSREICESIQSSIALAVTALDQRDACGVCSGTSSRLHDVRAVSGS
mgnify:CR=1 FL=1